MHPRFTTLLRPASILVLVTLCLAHLISYARPLRFTLTSNDGTECGIMLADGRLTLATLAWRLPIPDPQTRSRLCNTTFNWPNRTPARGALAELGFFRATLRFEPGNVFYGPGLLRLAIVRVPFLPFLLLASIHPLIVTARADQRRRTQAGKPPLSQCIPTAWKWIIAHTLASYALFFICGFVWGGFPPPGIWIPAPVAVVLVLGASLGGLVEGGPLQGLFFIAFYLIFLFGSAIALGVDPMSSRHQRRLRAGLCPECGYDLRATPERCPECGNVPT